MPAIDDAACAAAEIRLAEEQYLVDNAMLKSKSSGIRYRLSPALDDADKRAGLGLAKFGDVVEGVSFPDGWLMLGRRRFLPKQVQGVPVLVPVGGEAVEDGAHGRASPAPGPRPGGTGARAQNPPPPRLGSGDDRKAAESERPGGTESAEAPPSAPAKHDPLFELVGSEITSQELLLDNLLRLRSCIRSEGFDINVRSPVGNTPLMLATIRGNLDYCVVLIEAGAETSMPVPQSPSGRLAGLARWGPARALVQALTGEHSVRNAADLHSAMDKLQPEVKPVASLLIRRAAAAAGPRKELHEDHGDEPARRRGVLYKVVYAMVPIFEEPSSMSAELAQSEAGCIIEVFEYDRTRSWGHVKVGSPEGDETWGWMPLQNDVLGELLVPL